MTRSKGIKLTESFEVVHGQLVAQEMQKDVLEGASLCRVRSDLIPADIRAHACLI